MKIAMYKYLDTSYISPNEVLDWIEESKEYVRTTEIKDVEFVDLPANDLVAVEIESLDSKIEAIKAEAMLKVEALQGRKQELLALGGSDEQV